MFSRYRLAAAARRLPSARLYSSEPRSSAWPAIRILTPGLAIRIAALRSSVAWSAGPHHRLVVIEVDHGGEVGCDGPVLLGRFSGQPLFLQSIPLGAIVSRLRSRLLRCGRWGRLGRRLLRSRLPAAGDGKGRGGQEHQQRGCAHHHSEIMGWGRRWSARGGGTTTEAERRLALPAGALGRFRHRRSRSDDGRCGRK